MVGWCSASFQRLYINDWLIVNSPFVIIRNYKLHFLSLFAYLDCYLCIFTLEAVLVSCDWSAKSYGAVSHSWVNKQTQIWVEMEHSAYFNTFIHALGILPFLSIGRCKTQVFEWSSEVHKIGEGKMMNSLLLSCEQGIYLLPSLLLSRTVKHS